MAKKEEHKLPSRIDEFVDWLGGDPVAAADLNAKYHAAFTGEGIPEGAVKSYIERVFPGLKYLIANKLGEAVRAEFAPAVKKPAEPQKGSGDGKADQ